MKNQKNRSMKVHAQSGYNYKATPTIILKGQWLQEMGFEIGDYISVNCEDGKLIITPDAEKAAIAKAETEFMEKEMKKLQKKFQKEKEMLHIRRNTWQRVLRFLLCPFDKSYFLFSFHNVFGLKKS